MTAKKASLVGLAVGALAVLAALAVPFIERWLDQRAIGIQVVEPIRLSLLDAPNSRGTGPEFVTVLLIQNRGRETLEAVHIPIEFSGLRGKPIQRFNISTQPRFEVIAQQGPNAPLTLVIDYLNPGDAINFHLVSEVNPLEFVEPRIKGTRVSISKTSLDGDRVTVLTIVSTVLAVTGLLIAMVMAYFSTRSFEKIRSEVQAALDQATKDLDEIRQTARTSRNKRKSSEGNGQP